LFVFEDKTFVNILNQPSEKSALTISRSPIRRVPFFSDKKQQQFLAARTMLAR